MLNHNWNWLMGPVLVWIWLTFSHNFSANGQSQNAIGAHRAFQKTSFSCTGRPAGYYADIETGCQVYHMCDGLGRQFSYSCPNTTLFQQRMLICDHWYMVNCSKAESNYAANLLIGQRDKPFVNDEENSLRTPRPDLLDRPYAPDYSGESFRNQYKQLPAVQNQIQDSNAQKNLDKTTQPGQLAPGQQRWKIPPPSRTILPPAYEPQILDEASTTAKATQYSGVRFVPTTQATTRRHSTTTTARSTTTTTTTTRRPTTAPTRKQNFANFNNAALHQRQQQQSDHEDLGTSHSTRYNTSADFNSAERSSSKTFNSFSNRKSFTAASTSTTTTTTAATKLPIKVPSKIYEPPFLYPIYNQDDAPPATETPLKVSTAAPFKVRATTRSTTATTTTTTRPPSRPTTLAGKPFTAASFAQSSVTASPQAGRNQNNLLQQNSQQSQRFDKSKAGRTPTPAQGFKPPTPRPPINSAKTLKPPTTQQKPEASPLDYKVPTTQRLNLPTPFISASASGKPELPANNLLPPFHEFVQHDIATTQGPPIYYEWKVPSNGLEPPKLDPPIGVDGREYPETIADYNKIDTNKGFTPSTTTFGIDQQPKTSFNSFASNPFLSGKPTTHDISTTRTPTSRSIKETAQPNSVHRNTVSKKSTTRSPTVPTASASSGEPASDLNQLRKDLSVPEYAFPLENIGRTGYLSADTYNSFQLKIPERRIDTDEHLHWFGENPKCPECHPSYVVAGTCQPCLRR